MDKSRLNLLIEELHLAQKQNSLKKEIECLLRLGEFHYNNSDFIKARMSLNNILKLDGGFANVNYYLALIEINEDNYDKAIKHLEKELKINPKNNYARELKEKINVKSNMPIITVLLVLLNLLVFIYTSFSISFVNAIKYGLSTFNFEFFNIISSLFFHVNIVHFLVNMIILLSFGLILEKHIGSLQFLFVYLISGILGNFLEVYLVGDGIVIGASAALFGILGALMMREPLLKVKFIGIFDVPIIIVLSGFFLLSFIMNYIYDIGLISGDVAHFSGLLVGIFLIGIIYQETIDVFYNWVFISLGFWMIQIAIDNLVSYDILIISSFVLNLVYVLIGLFVIYYSYMKLKKISTVGGIEG